MLSSIYLINEVDESLGFFSPKVFRVRDPAGECIKDRISEMDSATDVSAARGPSERIVVGEEQVVIVNRLVRWHARGREESALGGPGLWDIVSKIGLLLPQRGCRRGPSSPRGLYPRGRDSISPVAFDEEGCMASSELDARRTMFVIGRSESFVIGCCKSWLSAEILRNVRSLSRPERTTAVSPQPSPRLIYIAL